MSQGNSDKQARRSHTDISNEITERAEKIRESSCSVCKQAPRSHTVIFNEIAKRAEKIHKSLSSACIYRVPKELRKLNESAYTPCLFSIGPLHSEDKRLKSPMQNIKMWYVNRLLGRMNDGLPDSKFAVFKECIEAMKLSVEDAKKSYTEEVDNLNEEMLVIDGCFILELLFKYYCCSKVTNPKEKNNEESKKNVNEGCFILELLYKYYRCSNAREKTSEKSKKNTKETSDPVFGSSLMFSSVLHDLLLLENQLPFFVLEKLFHITVAKIEDHPPDYSLFDYVILYFSNMMSQEDKSTTSNATNCCWPSECVLSLLDNMMDSENKGDAAPKKSEKGYYHILHALHDHYLPRDPPEGEDYSGCCPPKEEDYSGLIPSASNLAYAGVKFVAGTGENLFKVNFTEAKSCLAGCFHRAPFEISTLNLDDSTEVFLRNLIAFEQYRPGISCYFTSYAFLMDKLVDTEKDVEVLRKAGIIKNYLGSDQEASDVFNNLCKEVVLEEFYFAETCKKATQYSKRCWPAAVAHVRRQYFATPWTFIAFFVAFIAFGMSITQFVRSFLK